MPPVRLPPAGARWRPLPPAAPGGVVDGVRVVQVGPGQQPRPQPVQGLLRCPAPPGGVEPLDPGAGPAVVVRQRTVDLRVAPVVAAGGGVPAVGPRVVRVLLDAADRLPGAGRALLVHAAEQAVPLVPVVQRPEERGLGQGRPYVLVVQPDAVGLGPPVLPERGDDLLDPVPGPDDELRGEARGPGRQGGQLVLERPGDDRAEVLAQSPLELAVHPVDQRRARGRRTVVEALAQLVHQHQPGLSGPGPDRTAVHHRHRDRTGAR